MQRHNSTYVVKRDGRSEDVHFDKITSRIQKLSYGLNMEFVDPVAVAIKVISGLYKGVTTVELDNLAAETAASMTTQHPEYALLAARIAVSNLHKKTNKVFSEVMRTLHEFHRAKYEAERRVRKVVKARKLWEHIVSNQIETGLPYITYKDAANRKSNQQNLGTIKCSNLCTEIMEYSAPDEVAVCNLASIALNRFVTAEKKFDYAKLAEVTKVITRNLNKIIDVNYYPVEEARNSNMRHRPIGLGVQGLADCFMLMRFPFTSPQARDLNKRIFETIYYAALEASCELAEKEGPYSTYQGSPVSKGQLQFDMWGVAPTDQCDWDSLRKKIAKGLWSDEMKNRLIANNGSIQNIAGIPDDVKELYRTVWEISQKEIIEMAADRGAFIDQSQSLNIHMAKPSYAGITSMHFYGWKKGLKTGMYYLRTKPAVNAVQFTVDKAALKSPKPAEARVASPVEQDEGCLMCSG